MANNDNDLGRHMEGVARQLLGEPNKSLSTPGRELRFGNNGSLSVDLKKGTCFAFDAEEGGGVLWLLRYQLGLEGKAAFDWLKEHGFHVEDRREQRPEQAGRPAASGRPAPAPASAPTIRNAPSNEGEKTDMAPAPRGKWHFLKLPPDTELRATYDYVDELGELQFQVCRFEWTEDGRRKKSFRQRRPDQGKRDGWAWDVKDKVRQVPYRLPEVLESIANGASIAVMEGEKNVDRAWTLGIPATCNAGGAGKWPVGLSGHFRDADVVILPDWDPQKTREKDGSLLYHEDGRPQLPGQDHAALVARELLPAAASVRVLELARHYPELPPKGDFYDWAELGGTADAYYELLPEAVEAEAWDPAALFLERHPERILPVEGETPALPLVMWGDIGKKAAAHEPLIKGLLTRGELGMVAGASQAGKTFVVLDMAMSIARGVDFLGHKVRQGGVVYQAGEGVKGLENKRIPAYKQHHGVKESDPLPFGLVGVPIDLMSDDADTEKLIQTCKVAAARFAPIPLELVVIDTFSNATPGANENASEDVSRALKRCERIRAATGAAVLLVHHMNADGSKARGHTSLQANVETVLFARQVPDSQDGRGRRLREIEVAKQKDGDPGRPLRFVLGVETIGYDEDRDPVTSCFIDQPEGRHEPTVPAEGEAARLSPASKLLLRSIDEAIQLKPLAAPEKASLPQGIGGCHVDTAKRFFALRYGMDEPDQEKAQAELRAAWKKGLMWLQAAGYVARWGDYLWRCAKGTDAAIGGGLAPADSEAW